MSESTQPGEVSAVGGSEGSPSKGAPSSSEAPVLIVGGGVSGLSLAYRLHERGVPFLLFEASPSFGGNIQTIEQDGFLYDAGPDSFLKAKPAGVGLLNDLGLEGEMITPQEAEVSVYVAHDGRLQPMPEGLSLGVPKRPWPVLFTPLLSPGARLRALCEPWVPKRVGNEEETIHDFLARRLGSEMAERLAAPLLSGVFAGDAQALSMDAAFGQMILLEQKYGSLFAGMNGGKTPWQVMREPVKKAPSPFVSLRRGMGQLVGRLLERLPGQCLRTEAQVSAVEETSEGARVCVDGEWVAGRHAAVAGPPWVAARLLGPLSPELGEPLARIRGHMTATVFLGLDLDAMSFPLAGSGFIVPPGEGEILAGTFVSSKWSGRAPDGQALVRAFVGGARENIESVSDEELVARTTRELTRLMGNLGPVSFSRVFRWSKGTPQPELGHKQRVARAFAELERRPGLSLLGSGYGAVGIPDCIAQANQLAERLSG